MANLNTFNCLTEDLLLGKHVIGTSAYKVCLTNIAPVATNLVHADITEIAAGNGYAAGGAVSVLTKSRTLAVTKVLAADVVVSATGAVGPFRYEVLYNSTNDALVGWTDHGVAVTMANTDTHTIDFDGVNGIMTIG